MNYIVTIARQFGAGGRIVGNYIAQKCNIPYFDNELIEIAARKNNVNKEFYENYDEKASNMYASMFHTGISNGYFSPIVGDMIINDKLFETQSNIIKENSQFPAVFVGRCADYVLRDKKNIIRVFLYADIESRKKRISETYVVSYKNIEKAIVKADRQRASYYNTYTDMDWGVAENYDLCINTSKLELENVGEVVLNYVKQLEIQHKGEGETK